MARIALRRLLLLLPLVLLGVVATPCAAQDDAGNLVGLGLHQETGRDIYVGGIYLGAQTPPPARLEQLSGPRIMAYRIVARRTSMRSLLGGMLLQGEIATGAAPDTITGEFASAILAAVPTSLYAGDLLEIRLDARSHTSANLNGHQLAQVASAKPADYLLAGWLGEKGSSTAFRDNLMAPEVNPELLASYQSTVYTPDRAQEVAAWLASPAAEPATEAAEQADPAVKIASGGLSVPATVPATEPTPIIAGAAQAEPTPTEPRPAGPIPAESTPAALSGKPETTDPTPTGALAVTIPAAQPQGTAADADVQSLGVQEYAQRLAEFQARIIGLVYRNISYPKRAVRRNLEGRLELDITVMTDGTLVDVAVVRTSGHTILDEAAVTAALGALSGGGLGAIDAVAIAEFGGSADTLVIPVPVSFTLQ